MVMFLCAVPVGVLPAILNAPLWIAQDIVAQRVVFPEEVPLIRVRLPAAVMAALIRVKTARHALRMSVVALLSTAVAVVVIAMQLRFAKILVLAATAQEAGIGLFKRRAMERATALV